MTRCYQEVMGWGVPHGQGACLVYAGIRVQSLVPRCKTIHHGRERVSTSIPACADDDLSGGNRGHSRNSHRNSRRTRTRSSRLGMGWANCPVTQSFSNESLLTHEQKQWFPETESLRGREGLRIVAMVTKWHLQNRLEKQQRQGSL